MCVYVCVCVCVCACMRACVRACMHVGVHAWMCMCVWCMCVQAEWKQIDRQADGGGLPHRRRFSFQDWVLSV